MNNKSQAKLILVASAILLLICSTMNNSIWILLASFAGVGGMAGINIYNLPENEVRS